MSLIPALTSKIHQNLEMIDFCIPPHPAASNFQNEIQNAHIYPLVAGGKRIRPLLALLMAQALGGEVALETALPSAMALEMVHTYTLVHDDLPCMDDDDLRRGRPTTHKVYGDAKALLVGDGLLAQSFLTLTKTKWPNNISLTKELVEILALATSPGGVIWGQWLDLSLTGFEETTWEQMEIVHTFKTGVLLAASLEMGLVCGMAYLNPFPSTETQILLREKIKKSGIHIGLAFQIRDDILDGTKTTKELGKTAGKDEDQNKLTALRLLGSENAQLLCEEHTKKAEQLLKEIFAYCPPQTKEFQNEILNLVQQLLVRGN